MPSLDRSGDRKAVEERSLEKRARHAEALFEGIDDAVFVHDTEGRILDANPAACRRLGYSRDELLRMTTRDVDDPQFATGFEERLQEQLASGHLCCEGSHVTKDGRRIPVDINTALVSIDGKLAVLAVMRDITARKLTERRQAALYSVTRALAESPTLADAAPPILAALGDCLSCDLGACWVVDESAGVLRCVATWRAPGGADAAAEARTQSQALAPGQGPAGRAWAEGGLIWCADLAQEAPAPHTPELLRAGLRGGFAVPVRCGGSVAAFLEFLSRPGAVPDVVDTSMCSNLATQVGQYIERRRAEEAQQRMQGLLAQSEKLASIGLLSAGVAHEINNPLAYVGNNLVVLERDVKGLRDLLLLYEGARDRLARVDPDTARAARELAEQMDLPYVLDNLDRILGRTREGVGRMAKIVQSLRSLARTDRPQFEEANLPDLVEPSLDMVRGRLQRRGIRVELAYEPVPRVRCVSTQISQVLLNLLINAAQAIESGERPDGLIRVAVRRAGAEACLEVTDNGCGMDAKEVPHIFDPFYTSKAVGEGTGLGLSISHGIVTGHGGRIEVASRPGEGSTFRIFLPLDPHRGHA